MWYKNEYVMCRHRNRCALNRCALKRQEAHSPGQSEAAPWESNIDTPRPKRTKALIIKCLQFCVLYVFYAFALSGRGDSTTWIPGVPLRSAPGYVLAAFSRRIHLRTYRHFRIAECTLTWWLCTCCLFFKFAEDCDASRAHTSYVRTIMWFNSVDGLT